VNTAQEILVTCISVTTVPGDSWISTVMGEEEPYSGVHVVSQGELAQYRLDGL
jgi:hypothetical protein